MDLHDAKREIEDIKARVEDDLDADEEAKETLDNYFSDALSDVQFYIDKAEEEEVENSTVKTDFEEHNTLNHAQQGTKP